MRSVAAGVATTALLAFAAYTVYVVVVATASGEGHGSVFWAAIGLLVALALAAGWAARRVWRGRFV